MGVFQTYSYENAYHGTTNIVITDRYRVGDDIPETFDNYINYAALRGTPPANVNSYAALVSYNILADISQPYSEQEQTCWLPSMNDEGDFLNSGNVSISYAYLETVRDAYSSEISQSGETVQRQYFPYSPSNWHLMSDENETLYPLNIEIEFSSNMPIFETQEEIDEYFLINTEEARIAYLQAHCINYGDAEADFDNDTKDYYIYAHYGTCQLKNGQVIPGQTLAYQSLRFKANKTPTLVLNGGDSFGAILRYSDVVTSMSTNGPSYTIDNIPEEQWPNDTTYMRTSWIVDAEHYSSVFGQIPPNGNYTMSVTFQTNVFCFGTLAEAKAAEDSGDFSGAGNYYEAQNGQYWNPPSFGDPEQATAFGSGNAMSPFAATYVMSLNQVRDVSSVFFTDDSGIINDIVKGLELFGAKPMDSLIFLHYYPFSVNQIVTTSPTSDIYFGSYKHTLQSAVNRVYNMTANYINAGSILLKPIFNSWKDFEPVTSLHVYLPYIGWEKLDISSYIGKTVSIRYYVDIYTRACAAVLLANNVMIDYFTGEIGQELPIVGTNYAEYANNEIAHIKKTIYSPGTLLAGNAAAASFVPQIRNVASNLYQYQMGQNGSPKDIQRVKGSFTSGLGNYLPNYVMFRYDIHDVFEPELLNQLYGRPSTASGRVGNFSGFLSANTMKIDTSNMTESEISEVTNLLKSGIFV